jgi:hypothetical protein
MSRYAAWSRHRVQAGQAAEPSADFVDVLADELLGEPPEPLDAPDEPFDPLVDPSFDPLDDSLEDPLEDPLDEPDGAGTEAEELLRESVR